VPSSFIGKKEFFIKREKMAKVLPPHTDVKTGGEGL
jgi:hypothetical protein